MSLRFHRSGADRAWQFRGSERAQDPVMRRHIYGPIRPMEEPGFFARLFGRR